MFIQKSHCVLAQEVLLILFFHVCKHVGKPEIPEHPPNSSKIGAGSKNVAAKTPDQLKGDKWE